MGKSTTGEDIRILHEVPYKYLGRYNYFVARSKCHIFLRSCWEYVFSDLCPENDLKYFRMVELFLILLPSIAASQSHWYYSYQKEDGMGREKAQNLHEQTVLSSLSIFTPFLPPVPRSLVDDRNINKLTSPSHRPCLHCRCRKCMWCIIFPVLHIVQLR